MASLHRHSSGVWRIRFRFGGASFFRSLETHDEQQAGDIQRAIERTMGLLNDGTLTLPPAATPDDVWMFLRSGGRTGRTPRIEAMATTGDVIDAYLDSIPAGAKSDNSLQTERIHTRHFRKLLGHLTPLQKIGPGELQGYVNHRARRVSATTIKKELQTFHQIRDFALARGLVTGELPRKQVRLPKPPDKPPFATRDEIARQLDRLGLTGKEGEESEFWECLYLREAEVLDLLAHVKRSAAHPFIYPMVAMPAFTGCRRSEMLRSQVSDFDMEGGTILIREKKRRKDRSLSFRRVELNARLKAIMAEWFKQHPGGPFTICAPPGVLRSKSKRQEPDALTVHQAAHYFKATLATSEKWKVVRGFHALRHSFISACAAKKVPQPYIDAWVGHTTEDMRMRYRHLYPEQTKAVMGEVFKAADVIGQ
ncbi:MAG: site-specific integrase [Planctomycetes bacterium]|nr:site-specific integrase [Planctomycetota bacterium]